MLLDEHGNPVEAKTEEPAAPAEPKPEYAAAADTAELRNQVASLQESIAQMRGALEYANRPQPTAAPAAPIEPEITDEAINQALSEGSNAATAIRRLTKQMLQSTRSEVQQLRDAGLASIARLAEQQAASLPRFKDYEREIREYVGRLSPEAQASPDVWKLAHSAVIGAHTDDIVKRETEAALRRAREEAAKPSLPGQNGSSQSQPGEKEPKAEDYGALEFLTEKDQDPDSFARKLGRTRGGAGYKDFNDYIAKTKDLEDPFSKEAMDKRLAKLQGRRV